MSRLNNAIVAYLEEKEANCREASRFFTMNESPHNPMRGFFFVANTPQGAIVKIHKYIKSNSIEFFGEYSKTAPNEILTLLIYGQGVKPEVTHEFFSDIANNVERNNFRLIDDLVEDFNDSIMVSFDNLRVV